MRLHTRLAIAHLAVILLVVGLATFLRVRREIAAYDRGMRRAPLQLGRSLARAMAHAWQAHGEQAAMDYLRDAVDPKGPVRVRWTRLDDPDPAARPQAPPAGLAALRAGKGYFLPRARSS